MILAALGLGAVGLWFVIAGDAPARVLGLLLIAAGAALGYLFWIALTVERPEPGRTTPSTPEVQDG
jgi:hypothetical protein